MADAKANVSSGRPPLAAPGRKSLADLLAIMAALRTPKTGCPWDLEQNFSTIAPFTIEEAYEVADAIARNDMGDLAEELGDLLLQVVFHARMGEEAGHFNFEDVVDGIAHKMLRRHPHVFGSGSAENASAVKGLWENIKAAEKAGKGRIGTLADVPVALPSLTRAVKLQGKAAKVGFDWPSLGPVLAKMREELGELEHEIGEGTQASRFEEFGDLLFVMANVARHLKIDPEAALSAANAKFERRFAAIERALEACGRTPEQSTLEEMDKLWDKAKEMERKTAKNE
ncbi:MAG: nucleoside triphosphate pyrophosphohydrolase [Hyphomicrobiaceae bacterium]|nr:MAG: nucleoside triphosphate pyrophosphohydrolase [Hyphomicrobiaceae bacterium]